MDEKIWIEQPSQFDKLNPEAQEDFTILMSLRLDQLLDAEEEGRFQRYLSQYAQCGQQWRRWQQLHQRFSHAPHMEPPIDFARQFSTRLEQQERRQQLWWGATVGALFLLLWVGMVIGTVAFGVLLVANQPLWISDLIHNLAYWGASLRQGVGLWWDSFNTFLATPQAQGMGIAYLVLAVALLALWVRVLRRTTRIEEMVSMM